MVWLLEEYYPNSVSMYIRFQQHEKQCFYPTDTVNPIKDPYPPLFWPQGSLEQYLQSFSKKMNGLCSLHL